MNTPANPNATAAATTVVPATDTWAGRTVLVTGAEGFIGSTLVDLLAARGARVRALVHYKPYAEKGHLAGHLAAPDGPVEMWAATCAIRAGSTTPSRAATPCSTWPR